MQRRRNGPGLLATGSTSMPQTGNGLFATSTGQPSSLQTHTPPSLNSITFDPQRNLIRTHSVSWDADEHNSGDDSRPQPRLTDIMVADEDYIRSSLVDSSQFNGGGYGIDYECTVMCAKFCAGFSFVAVLFLVFAGVLIHKQPLYIKGIKLKKQEIYEMHPTAKTSFKTAAAYFLVMVFSMIYAQNHQRFKWNICQKVQNAIHLRQHFAVAYSSYRRREYNNIPEDVSSTAPDLPTFEDILSLGRENPAAGEEDTSADQIASFELWKKVHSVGNIMSANLEKAKRR